MSLRIALCSTIVFVLSASAAYAQEPEKSYTNECGAASKDLFTRDLTENSAKPVAFCSFDNDLGPFATTLGVNYGEEDQTRQVWGSLSLPLTAGRLTVEPSVGLYYFWETEQFITSYGGEATLDLGFVTPGLGYTKYDEDFVDSTTSAFLLFGGGPFDFELGYSWLDSGGEGPYGEIGYTFGRRFRVALQGLDNGTDQAFAVRIAGKF